MNRLAKQTLLVAAVAAVPLFGLSSRADAQARVNADGHAMDASNRVGSGGRNPHDSAARVGEQVSGNDIIYGNVTGGKHFRGAPYTDPRAFRGNTSDRNMDNFIRQSSGPDSRLAETVQPFYGQGRGVAPPPGFVQTAPGSGAYIPSNVPATRAPGDNRLGVINLAAPQIALPQPGELMLPGPVDPTGGQLYITASPLTGIQQINPAERIGTTTHTQYNPVTNVLDEASVWKMREEMNREAGVPLAGTIGDAGQTAQTDPTAAAAAPTAPGAKPLAGAEAITQKPITGAVDTAKPIDTRIATAADTTAGQSIRQRLVPQPPSPEQQSTVFADLVKRQQALKKHQDAVADATMTDEEANRAFVAARAQQQQPGEAVAAAPNAAQPGAAQPGAAPGAPQPPAPGITGAAPKAQDTTAATGTPDFAKQGAELLKHGVPKKKPEPIKVPSLSQGVKGKGLGELLKTAEDLMKDGKFTSALDRYDQAEQVAPNNPLIKLGRANAELGAAYYARADAHLRDVLTQNPELLSGQYDLTAMLGEQRLTVLVRDLKEIANKDQTEARPVFLLAYIYYNTGDIQRADGYIDLADKRSGGKDPFFKLLRDNWTLPEKALEQPAATPEANK